MSGICGFIGAGREISERGLEKTTVLKAMCDRIAHRGPDGEGQYIDNNAALGQRRLAVIDTKAAAKPLTNEDGTIVLTANATIYNFCELREELTNKGHNFATNMDSEVIIHGYEEYGKGILNKLRGMFAFILWDTCNELAFGARDGFGVRHFYYTQREDTLIYSSEIKSLLEYPGFIPELNEEALEQYLSFQYSALPESFFKGVFKLAPGTCFTYRSGVFETERFFDPLPAARTVDDIAREAKEKIAAGISVPADPFDYMVERIKSTIEASVEAHLVSDVEIASLLSSGIDSSYIAALSPNRKTYTVGFETADGVKYNEISYAHIAAEELGREHITKVISSEEYWDNLGHVMYHMDEPLADPSAVALFFLTKMVSKDVKVVFSGEGADEFFGGYPIYHEPLGLAGFQKLPRGLRRALAAVAKALPFRFKGKSFLDRASKTVEERYISNAYLFTKSEREKLLKNPMYAPDPTELTRPFYDKVKGCKDTNKMQYIDYNFWGPGDIMLKGDKMAMANGLEVRSPLLDLRVFELANTLPVEFMVNGQTTKLALRAAANDVLPARITQKPKLGFPTPTRVWLKEQRWYNRVREAFEGPIGLKFFNVAGLVKLLDEHYTGKADNSRKIWNVYVFIVWYQVYFEDVLGRVKPAWK